MIKTKSLGDVVIVRTMPSMRNTNYLIKDENGKRYIYKQYQTKNPHPDKLMQELVYLGLDIKLKRRSVKEILNTVDNLTKIGIQCPAIIEYGKGYTIEEFIDGQQIDQITDWDKFIHFSGLLLTELHKAHTHQIVLGDRWFESQIIHKDGTIFFIDLDMEYEGSQQKELEMAEMLNALSFERSFEEVVEVAKIFTALPEVQAQYNIDSIISTLNKHIAYWSDPQNILGNLIDVIRKKIQT